MFRSIESSVDKRKNELEAKGVAFGELDEIVQMFLKQVFSDVAGRVAVYVSKEKNTVTIQTTNKVIAQEIVFQSAKLYGMLKEKLINCDQIVVR